MSSLTSETFTAKLRAWRSGDEAARDEVILLIYQELRRLAQSYLKHERQSHTLQATALVNEAYVRLCGQGPLEWNDRQHFFRAVAQTMRRILVDYARERNATKRPDNRMRIALDDAHQEFSLPRDDELIALDEALDRLQETFPRTAEIIVLRYFGGLTEAEVATVLTVSRSTVTREWLVAKGWLYRRITSGKERSLP
jgi:RNA polymerase sigma factor (TIGR02999 family)